MLYLLLLYGFSLMNFVIPLRAKHKDEALKFALFLANDKNQLELANFVQDLDNKGAKIVISNSDPKNTDENDNFFDDAYAKQTIKRISATRMINRNSEKRGRISELLISNF